MRPPLSVTSPWTPDGFDDWQLHFPATAFARPDAQLDRTAAFVHCWQNRELRLPNTTLVVLIAGLFSEWLPRCFHGCAQALKRAGYPVLRMPVSSSRGVMSQGQHIAKVLQAQLKPGQRFVVLAHSKGGLDTLAALLQNSAVHDACDGVALVQPPAGPSTVVDELLGCSPSQPGARHPLDRLRRTALRMSWMAAGARDISSRRDPQVAQMLGRLPGGVLHCVHVVSWSAVSSSRQDTYHARLNALRPGCAHDGQFYIENLLIHGVPQICLPRLDHGQPMLGGGGFDATRFWLALLSVLHDTKPA